jgi:hypothetical protein
VLALLVRSSASRAQSLLEFYVLILDSGLSEAQLHTTRPARFDSGSTTTQSRLRRIAQLEVRRHERRGRAQHHGKGKSAAEKPLSPVSRFRLDFFQGHNWPRGQ